MNLFFTDCRLFFLCKMVDKLPDAMFNCTLEINKTDARVATTAFLSPLYQSLLSVTEKKIIKKCLKE